MLGCLGATFIPGVMDRIQLVRMDATMAKNRGMKRDQRGVRCWKKRAYWRHDVSAWCDANLFAWTWEGIVRACSN